MKKFYGKCSDCNIKIIDKKALRCRKCWAVSQRIPFEKQFYDHIKKTKTCWFFCGSKTMAGYGILRTMGNRQMAHRFSWSIYRGFIPSGLFVCHRCDNPSCVRPSHLFLGTPKENIKDMIQKGRKNPAKGEGAPCVVLSEKSVKNIRSLYRPWKFSTRMLAKKFGVGHTAIQNIISRISWKHI